MTEEGQNTEGTGNEAPRKVMYMVVSGEEVLGCGTVEEGLEEYVAPPVGQVVVVDQMPIGKWWNGEALMEKTEMPVAVNGTSLNVPAGTTFSLMDPFFVEGQAGADGLLEFEFDEPGEYRVELKHPRYFDKEVVVYED